jgi:hypothetical protein
MSIGVSDLDEGAPQEGGYLLHSARGPLPGGVLLISPARTKKVLFHLPDRLEPATYVELHVGAADSTNAEYWSYVFSAVDGSLLFRNDLTARDSFKYRVWADAAAPFIPFDGPQGTATTPKATPSPDGQQPPFVAPNLVTLQNAGLTGAASNDPWLPAGATETNGNNVDAYVDLSAPDGFSGGDFRATVTSAGTFDRTYDVTKSVDVSQDQRMAAITQLFYNVNFFHDWYYVAGFTEVAGNGQKSNYGRGGIEGDPVHAEAQDYSGTDNANMSTPADGASPRMQMYVWPVTKIGVTVTAPSSVAGNYTNVGPAQFGPSTFDVTGTMVTVVDSGGDDPNDGCDVPYPNAAALSGNIAVVNRGNCNFTDKVKNAQAAGAIAVVVVNNTTGLLTMAGTDPSISIPALIMLQDEGGRVRDAAKSAGVTGHIFAKTLVSRDGTIDNQIVGHEWGHYISNRLISDANGLNVNVSRGMGEGWADTHAMLMTVRPEDAQVASNATWNGVYPVASYATYALLDDNFYFGIRRYPYSTDMTKNPLTFKHITDGVALPVGPPNAFGADGADNSEVHNIGEVWASMLWECYASLLRATQGGAPRYTFDQARDKWKGYMVAAYKLTPPNPTFLEARDAMLAAALASSAADYADFLTAFAKRGAGTHAIAPDRYMVDNSGLVEDFTGGANGANDVAVVSATIDDSGTAVCTADGNLDAGESGKLTVVIKNMGAGSLSSVSATVTSSNAAVTFPSGNTLTFTNVAQRATAQAQVAIQMASTASGLQAVDLTLTFTGSGVSTTFTAQNRMNFDVVANQSATDNFEAATSPWTTGGASGSGFDTAETWRIVARSPIDHRYYMPDTGFTDQWLISPQLVVSSAANFTVSFKHRHSFVAVTSSGTEFDLDGGVIEYSADDGATWKDVTDVTQLAYPGSISGGVGSNLNNRNAFVKQNAAWPNQDTLTLNFGTNLGGKTIRLRFRSASVAFGDDFGWEIDDVAATGLANLPFPSMVGRAGTACNKAPTANAGSAASAKTGDAVKLDGSGSSDPDGDALTYTWVQQSGPKATLDNANAVKPGFTAPNVRGSVPVVFALIVNDGKVSSAPSTVTITVSKDNTAPVANAGPNQNGNGGANVTLDGTGSTDAEGDVLSYKWTQVSGATVAMTGATTSKPSFTAPSGGGTLTFQLIVNDGLLDSQPATVKVNVSGGGCSSAGLADLSAMLAPLAAFALSRRRRR